MAYGVKNTDDHLRNHGFLLTESGWALSPAYDINLNEYGNGLHLNISTDDNSLDIDLALSVAEYFRLDEEKATQIIEQVTKGVSSWKQVATKYKLSRSEQEQMAAAFSL